MAQVLRRHSTISRDITAARGELDRLAERLRVQASHLEDVRLRSLIAETPLADGQFQQAAAEYRLVERAVRRAEASLAELREEEERLKEMTGTIR